MLIFYFFPSFVPQSSDLNVLCQKVGEECICWRRRGSTFTKGWQVRSPAEQKYQSIVCVIIAIVCWFTFSQTEGADALRLL